MTEKTVNIGSITVTVTYSWWVIPYMWSVAIFARTFGLTPDLKKVVKIAKYGMKTKVSWG